LTTENRASKKPLVSIITPSLNQGTYIAQAISSVGEQEYPHVEHIIVDGGSTDETLDVIRSYEDIYDLRWISEPDGGMYEAINKGLHMARGEILAYLNSDDQYFPWTVSTVVEAMDAHPNAGFVFGDMLSVDEGAEWGMLFFSPPFGRACARRPLYQPTVFWRRSVFEDCGGFDESLQCASDYDYWMRIGARHEACKVNEVLAIERLRSDNKRFAHRETLLRELDEVRYRYKRPRIRVLMHRAYIFLCRRYYLSRFLLAYLQHSRLSAEYDGPWAAFLTRNGEVWVSFAAALATLLPFTSRAHFSRHIVRKDLTSLQRRQ
jgi:glycosyltransferase involved in cell wall biosynthesis